MSTQHPGLLYEVCQRFDQLKALTVSRHTAKRQVRTRARARGVRLSPLAPSIGVITSEKTLATYKALCFPYVKWARETYGLRRLAEIDREAERLVFLYLLERRQAGLSPYSLKSTRSALRMLHGAMYPPEERLERVRRLGADVDLPVRRREEIRRSRYPVAMDRALARERYQDLVAFCRATGLRRHELELAVVGDVQAEPDGRLVIAVPRGKGGRPRVVPVLAGHEQAVLARVVGRDPAARIFPRGVPVRLDCHAERRTYSQLLYSAGGRYPLPPVVGRLRPGSVDRAQVRLVSRALGHNRDDVVTRHYLR